MLGCTVACAGAGDARGFVELCWSLADNDVTSFTARAFQMGTCKDYL